MRIREFFKENIEETSDSIKYFNVEPLDSLGQLIPIGMVCVSVVEFFVAIIRFIINAGFTNQIKLLKHDFFGGISEGFTAGTVSTLTDGIVPAIIWIFFLSEIIIMIVSCYITESKAKKIIMSIWDKGNQGIWSRCV